MTMQAATVLRFVKFPAVSNRLQQTLDGRAWQIVKIEAPFCWARPHGSGEPLRQYAVQAEHRRGRRHGRPRQPDPEAVSEPDAVPKPEPEAVPQPEAVSEPERVSAPMPAPRERDDQRLYQEPHGEAAFIDMGRSAIASGALAPPD
jgi:hypothetical protein